MYRDLAQRGLRPRLNVRTDVTIGTLVNAEEKSFQQMIFQPENKKDAPRNDIGVFMSKHTAPEIVSYLKNTIMQKFDTKNADVSFSEADLKDLSDDDVNAIFDAMPYKGETLNQYEARVNSLIEKDKENVERSRWLNMFKNMKPKDED